jgi:NAD(P)-dependent dehydrogenase (short-subunit alcohol dehydrogenase family)
MSQLQSGAADSANRVEPVIVVTGASGALGRTVIAAANLRGAIVVGIDHGGAGDADSAPALALDGVDLAQSDQAIAAMKSVHDRFGRLDVLVNGAGGFKMGAVEDGPTGLWAELFARNLLTAANSCRAALPYLTRSPAGRIVNVGALAALSAAEGMGPYTASKSAVHRLTEALAAEIKGRGTINAVLPATLDTPANRAAMPQADFSRWASLSEAAAVILFLASDAASGVTGALIPIKGRT